MTVDWKLIGLGVAFVLIAFGAFAWLREHDARIKAESVQTAQQQVIGAEQKSIDDAKASAAQVASDLKQRLAALEAEKRRPETAPQFALDVSKLMPNLPQPVTVVQPAPAQQTVNGKTETLPSAPAIEIPAADLDAFKAYKLSCDESGAKADACALTEAADAQQLTATQAQLAAAEKERDGWRAAAKGGTWLGRLKKNLKCLAATSAGSFAGAYADKGIPGTGAAIGAVAGGVACQAF